MSWDAIIFYNGPKSVWLRGGKQAMGGDVSEWPEPDPSEIVARKTFRFRWMADGWVIGRLKGLNNLSSEIRSK